MNDSIYAIYQKTISLDIFNDWPNLLFIIKIRAYIGSVRAIGLPYQTCIQRRPFNKDNS